jgi:membrane-associated phospholipid phosphatase
MGRRRPTVTRHRFLLGVSLVGFVAVALDVTHHGLLERHDVPITTWVAGNVSDRVVDGANVITQIGSWWFVLALTLAGGLFLVRGGRKVEALLFGGAVAFTSLATGLLKVAFERERPAPVGVRQISSFAFPSGHTSSATVALVLLAVMLVPPPRTVALTGAALLAALVGVTRVLVQAHWTTDVVAGYLLGTAVVACALLARDALLGPQREDDGQQSGEEERERAGRALAEERAHDLVSVGDLAEPRGR